MWIAGFSLFVLGFIFVIVAPINRRKNNRCSAQTQGTLEKIFKTENANGHISHRYVYSYSVDGIEYKLRSTVSSPGTNKVGDRGPVWYNPKKPKEAQAFHYDSAKVYKILSIIGAGMLLLGIVLTLVGAG